MKKIVLTFGIISGLISVLMMAITIPMCLNGTLGFDKSLIIGYTTMVLAFSLVFFGIRSYRENVGGGTITFGKAFQIGLLITAISAVFYVAAWEVIYYNFIPDFWDRYTVHALAEMRAKGATDAALAATQKQMTEFKKLYENPLINAAYTFIEPLPVGIVITLISAAILRKKPSAPAGAVATA